MTWAKVLEPYKNSPEFELLWQRVKEEYNNYECFPPRKEIFHFLECTAFEDIKVVILGQDPYHVPGQAHGLSFSVRDGIQTPRSLQNIFKELREDIGTNKSSPDLTPWARQGVLLLNASLSVRAHQANSHSKLGWYPFTDFIIKQISEKLEHVVFILWGSFAQQKKMLINSNKHLIIEAVHPSPLSAHRGFFGSKPFSKTNEYLVQFGKKPIIW